MFFKIKSKKFNISSILNILLFIILCCLLYFSFLSIYNAECFSSIYEQNENAKQDVVTFENNYALYKSNLTPSEKEIINDIQIQINDNFSKLTTNYIGIENTLSKYNESTLTYGESDYNLIINDLSNNYTFLVDASFGVCSIETDCSTGKFKELMGANWTCSPEKSCSKMCQTNDNCSFLGTSWTCGDMSYCESSTTTLKNTDYFKNIKSLISNEINELSNNENISNFELFKTSIKNLYLKANDIFSKVKKHNAENNIIFKNLINTLNSPTETATPAPKTSTPKTSTPTTTPTTATPTTATPTMATPATATPTTATPTMATPATATPTTATPTMATPATLITTKPATSAHNISSKKESIKFDLNLMLMDIFKTVDLIYNEMRTNNIVTAQEYNPNSKYKINQPNPYYEDDNNYFYLSSIK
jgi:hypothetical protein